MSTIELTRQEIQAFHDLMIRKGFILEGKEQKKTKMVKNRLVPLRTKPKNPSNYGSKIYIREKNLLIVKVITTIVDELTMINREDSAKVVLLTRDGDREIKIHKEEYPRTRYYLKHIYDMATAFCYVSDDISYCPICHETLTVVQEDENFRVPPKVQCHHAGRSDHANQAYPDFMEMIKKHGGNAWQEAKKRFEGKKKYDQKTDPSVTGKEIKRKNRKSKWKGTYPL